MYSEYSDVLEYLPSNDSYRNDRRINSENIYLAIQEFVNEYCFKHSDPLKPTNICISLSGGVDSMVITACLLRLKSIYPLNIIAAHVEYGNRIESQKEAEFVEQWCIENNIIFEKEKIISLKRDEVDREEYEEKTRSLRFNLYNTIIAKYHCLAVILGHHATDIAENVFTNTMNGRDILDLEVIHPISQNKGITFWRPLVPFEKGPIFSFAHKYQIPYFKDTTPDWSNRGILRRQLFPKLEDRYGIGFKKNLISIGKQSTEWSTIIEKQIIEPFMKTQVNIGKNGAIIQFEDHKDLPFSFWNVIIKKILHSMGIGMASNKTIENLIKLMRLPTKESRIVLKTGLISYINGSSIIMVKENCIIPHQETKINEEIYLGKVSDQLIIKTFNCELTIDKIPNDNQKVRQSLSYDQSVVKPIDYINGQIIYLMPSYQSVIFSNRFTQLDSNTKAKFKSLPTWLTRYLPIISVNKSHHVEDIENILRITIKLGQ